MSTNYTAPQEYAIRKDYGNLLVSAAAGSGKTFTLSSRIVELIKAEKADIDEMLVVTFTKASAADMKRKIAKRLSDSAKDERKDNPELSKKLSKSAIKAQSADISTIHSFLYRIIRRNLSKLELPQDSRLVSNDAILNKLKSEAMNEVIGELFDKNDRDFSRLADVLATVRDTSSLDESLLKISETLSNNGLNHSAVRRYAEKLDDSVQSLDDLLYSGYGEVFLSDLIYSVNHYLNIFDDLAEECSLYDDINKIFGPELQRIRTWLSETREAIDARHYTEIKNRFAFMDWPKWPQLRKSSYPELQKELKHHRENLKDLLADKINPKFDIFPEEEILLSKEESVKMLEILASVLERYYAIYQKKKTDLSILDFKDIEQYAFDLLVEEDGTPTKIAIETGKNYKYIFIDEYQDTNEVQDAIFRAIGINSHRFMVGDIKQAIYHFRGADPDVFSRYRNDWLEIDPETEGDLPLIKEDGNVLLMSNNFRSTAPVTELTNIVSAYTLPFGKIPYKDGDELICSKKDGTNPDHPHSEVIVIEKKNRNSLFSSSGDDDGDVDETDPEVRYVAKRISELVGKHMGEKVIKAEDIAILTRSKTHASEYKDALSKLGITAVLGVDKPLDRNPSVQLLVCILNFVDNPLREVFTSGALRSPIFGFTSADLVALRTSAGNMPLFTGVIKTAENESSDSALREKCINALRWLEKQKTISRGMMPSKYIEYLIDEIDLYSIDGIRGNGNERNAVNSFISIAVEYEANSSKTYSRTDISAFLDYAEEVLSEKQKADSAPTSVAGAVAILTIHASKGLEYPIVFVVGCGSRLNSTREKMEAIPFDKRLGLGVMLPDHSGLAKCDTIFRSAIADSAVRTALNEEMRILYVALSRACDKLIVTGKVLSLSKFLERTQYNVKYCDGYSVIHASSYLSWIYEALEKFSHPLVDTQEYTEEDILAVLNETSEVKSVSDALPEEISGTDLTDYSARMDYTYPYGYLGNLPSMISVTKLSPSILNSDEEPEEIKGDISSALDNKNFEIREVKLSKPGFMIGEKMTSPTERGNATHAFFQFVDYEKLKEHGGESELERLLAEKYISEGFASIVNRSQIERFRDSGLMEKLMRAEFIKREFRFNLRMNADRLTTDAALAEEFRTNDVRVTVEGVVDLLYRDPDTGELTIVDYKTDSVSDYEWSHREEAYAGFRARHSNQLNYYRDICEKIFDEKIPHVYIYSTAFAELIEIDL